MMMSAGASHAANTFWRTFSAIALKSFLTNILSSPDGHPLRARNGEHVFELGTIVHAVEHDLVETGVTINLQCGPCLLGCAARAMTSDHVVARQRVDALPILVVKGRGQSRLIQAGSGKFQIAGVRRTAQHVGESPTTAGDVRALMTTPSAFSPASSSIGGPDAASHSGRGCAPMASWPDMRYRLPENLTGSPESSMRATSMVSRSVSIG